MKLTRFFLDQLTAPGDWYLIPVDRRQEWDAFDIECEQTSEQLPVPDWAQPLADGPRWIEFETPQEILR